MGNPGLRISPDLVLPLNAVTSTLVVYGAKGMGKTNFGAVLVEELKKAGLRFAVLDPVGVWWGLQHAASGKGPGIEVLVLGGVHGDLPIEPTAGAVAADLVADEEVDVVIDISRRSDGKMWSQGEKIRFVTDYATRLYERQGERMRPVMQVMDEAGRFVPQTIPSGAQDIMKCVGAIEQLVELGRNVGVGVTLITQRSARMNKSVSELADCMIAFRTVGPRSVDAILDWFGEHIPKERWKGLIEQLRSLAVGTALVVSPGWLQFEGQARIRARETFDSSATPGADPRRTSGRAAKPDLGKYRQLMAATIDKANADDPRQLRKRIVELERQLAQGRTGTRVEVTKERVEVPVLTKSEGDRLGELGGNLLLMAADLRDTADKLHEASGRILGALQLSRGEVRVQRALARRAPVARIDPVPQEHKRPATANRPAPRPEHSARNSEISAPQQRILDALASFEAAGLDQVARSNVAVFAGQSSASSGFANNLGALRSRGLIAYPSGGRVALTDDGRGAASWTEPIRSIEELHAAWAAKLSNPQWRIVSTLISVYPEALSRAELAERALQSVSSSGYANNLGGLRSLGLLDYPSQGMVAATELLFPPLPVR